MKLSFIAFACYVLYVVSQLTYLYVVHAYHDGRLGTSWFVFPNNLLNLAVPLLFAFAAYFVTRSLNKEASWRVFQWVLLGLSLLVGLFSFFAAYLVWWSANR